MNSSDTVFLDEHSSGHSAQDHFINAVEFMHLSMETQDPALAFWREHRLAIASILEAFVGVECEINEIGFRYLFDKSAKEYISEHRSNLPFELFRTSWERNLSVIEKTRWVLSQIGGTLDGRTEARLRELLVVRNWLAHGFIFRSTYLMDRVDDTTSTTVDREDSVDWVKRFPNLKFHSLDRLDASDAQTAVRVAFEILQLIRALTGTVDHIVYVRNGVPLFYEARAGANIDELLEGSSPSVAEVAARFD